MRSRSIAIVAVLVFAACSPYDHPAPTPTGILPDHMVSLRPERAGPLPVTVYADDLATGIEVDLKTGEVKFKGEFQVRLGDVSLLNIEPVVEDGALVLKAEAPADLPTGTHDLSVTSPQGGTGVLAEAFEVRSIASIDLQSDTPAPVAGSRVTVTAAVLDSAGDQVAAELASDVVFTLDTGSGTFGNPTLASGAVRVPYDTAATPEGALLRATEQLSGADVSGTLLVDSRAGDVAGVEIVPPNVQIYAGDTIDLSAELQDTNGNMIPAALVSDITFEVVVGQGVLGQPVVEANVVKIPYTAHTAVETAVVRATEQVSGSGHTADSQIAGVAGDAHQLHLTASPPSPVAGTATNVTAELQDVYGNPIAFTDVADVTFSKVSGRGILSASLLIGGQILVPYATYRKVETASIQGEVIVPDDVPNPIAQVDIRTVGGDPVAVELVPASPTVGAGTSVPLDAYLLDAEGNRSGATVVSDVTIAITAGPGTLDAPALFTDAEDVTAVRAVYNAENTVGQTIDFSATENVTGSANSAVASVDVVAGPVDHFDVFVGAPAFAAGSPFNISLAARDQFDNLADSFNGLVFISDTTGSIAPSISGDFLAGQRTETVIISQTMNNVTIHVEDVDRHAGDSAPFDVVGGLVDHFVIDPIADQAAGAPFDVTIRAMDELNNIVDVFTGTVNIQDTTATAAPAVSGAFLAGVRTEPTTIFTQHPAVILTVDDGIGHTGTSNVFAVSAGSPAAVVFISPTQNVLRDTPSAVLQVQVQDGFGNPTPVAADTTLDLQTSGAGCFDLLPTGPFDCSITSVTVAAGTDLGEFYYLDPADGDKTLTVSDPAVVLAPGIQNILISAFGDPSRLEIIQAPSSVNVDSVSGVFTVQLQDAAGNPVTSHPPLDVNITSTHAEGRFDTSAGGAFDGSITLVRILNGTSDATFYYKDTRAGPAEIDATEATLVGDTATVDVLAGPVDHFGFDPVASQQAGLPFVVHITAYDAFSNVATSFDQAVSLSDLTGTSSPITSGQFISGQRAENITVTQAISVDRLTATDASSHTGTSNDFEVFSGAVDHFSIDTISNPQNAGTPFQIHVEAKDAWDNIATGFIGVVNLADTTGTISPSQSGPFNQGQRDENITVTRAFLNDVVGVNDGAAGHAGISNPFDVVHGPLDHFAVGPVPAQVGADSAFDVPMQARDAWDNVVESFSGTVSLGDQTGTLLPATSGAFASGLRTESVTISQEFNDDFITADDGASHTGVSNLFDVIAAQPVVLTAVIEFDPVAVVEGEGFDLRLVVTNEGDYAAWAVAPVLLTYGGSGSATLLSGPTPMQTDIPARGQAVFVYRFKTGLGDSGWLDAISQAGGTSEETGQPVQSNTATGSIPITPASCLLNPLFAYAGGDRQVPCGGSTTLGGIPAAWGGVPDFIYDWLPDFALNDATLANPTAAPDINTKYRLTVFDQLGCGASDSAAVTLSDGPTAAFTASRQWVCEDGWVQFDASGSTGTGLTYDWEYCDGRTDTGVTDWQQFDLNAWCPVTLTVTDQNGCRDTATMGIGARRSTGEPTGPVTFSQPINVVPANGSTQITIQSDRIHECDGDETVSGKEFHVVATRGTILSVDTEGENGIQVDTDFQGRISVTIQSDTVGGQGRLLTTSNRGERDARGSVRYTFSGSTSTPQVVDFGPSGYSDLPPQRFAARFDKPMNPSTMNTVELQGNSSGLVPGTVNYDPDHRTLFFTPDALIDPSDRYTMYLCTCITDIWGNQLDAEFEWDFGNVLDSVPPTVSCRGESEDTFTPDDDGDKDQTEIRADLADDVRLKLWRVEIFSPEGLLVRTLVDHQSQDIDDVRLVWDGHDEDGLLVKNARYDYRVTAVDADGNVSVPCIDSVEVDTVLDPADFP